MARWLLTLVCVLVLAAGPAGLALTQAAPAESFDDVSADNDVLQQLSNYRFTVEQLRALVPILQGVEERRQAVVSYKASEEALAPVRAMRETLLKGATTQGIEILTDPVWTKLDELETSFQERLQQAGLEMAKLLTEEQLAEVAQGDEWAYEEADRVLGDLEAARALSEEDFGRWRDTAAAQIAEGVGDQGVQEADDVRTALRALLDKGRNLGEEDFAAQADQLLEQLQVLIASTAAAPPVDAAQGQVAQELELLLRSERVLTLVEAMIAAREG